MIAMQSRFSLPMCLALLLCLSVACAGPAVGNNVRALNERPGSSNVNSGGGADPARVALVKAFEEASNRHDLQTLEALLDPSVTWFQGEDLVFLGREEVLGPMRHDVLTNAHFSIESIQWNGSRARCSVREQNDFFRALGLDGLVQEVELELGSNTILSLTSYPPRKRSEEARTLESFLGWLQREQPKDFARLFGPKRGVNEVADLIESANSWNLAGRPR